MTEVPIIEKSEKIIHGIIGSWNHWINLHIAFLFNISTTNVLSI